MAITGNEDISIARKEVKESQVGSIQTTKTLIFKHSASEGDLVIDTTALTAPADALANGFIQDNPSALNLLVNKKNLKIHSSRGLWLQMHEDFKVTGVNTIQLIGNIASLGGALEGEVFTIYAVPVQSNSIITTDHKKQHQEYLLLDGQTILNLGREFEANRNPLSQIGAIRVWRNGVGPLLRNAGNVAANPLADGNYQEIDAGNGLGTMIEFNVAPSGQDDVIVVEFGLEYAGDLSLVGDIHAIWGSILKLAEDVKDLGPYDITRYLTANPSEVERRGFGDIVLGMLNVEVPVVGPVQTYVPVITGFGAVTGVEFDYRQVGEFYEIYGSWTNGTVQGVEAQISLPNGAVVKTGTYNNREVGRGQRTHPTTDTVVFLSTPGDNFLNCYNPNANVNPVVPQNGNTVSGSGEQIKLLARVPIEGLVATRTIREILGL